MTRTTCDKTCPEHGIRCCVVRASAEDRRIGKRVGLVFPDWETHVHLCISLDGKSKHTWVG